MFSLDSNLFGTEENEIQFREICQDLKNNSLSSPWKMCFRSDESNNYFGLEVSEFSLQGFENVDGRISPGICASETKFSDVINIGAQSNQSLAREGILTDEKKITRLKSSLMNVQDIHTVDHLEDLNILYTLPLSQIPEFCKILSSAILSETAIALFLSAILNLEQQISLSTAVMLIHHIVYPKIAGMKNSRIILASILTFSEIYPKAVIDEVMIPSLKIESLENLQSEMLFKMAKNTIPDDYVSYCVKNILEHAPAGENTFFVLQCLIERKIRHEQSFYDMLAWKIQSWALKYNSSIKFIKLLISILSVYGTELTNQHYLLYEDVIKCNKSIMKKAAENLLKKFKKQ